MTTGDNIWYTINTPTKDGYVFSMSVRGADKEMKKYVLEEKGYTWLGTEYKRKSRNYPRTIQVTSQTGRKLKKTVHEKQVVFWSEKYAKRAKADRAAALAKAADLAKNPGHYTRATSYGAAKYVKKIDYDKDTGEILTASSIPEIDETKLREEEALDGYYVLLTSEMEARPVYVWTRDHIEAHFLTCFVALTIARILETKLAQKYSIGKLLGSLSKAGCTLIQQNYYLFDYYDDVLKNIGKVLDIDFSKRIRSLDEIKKVLANTKKQKYTMKI